MLIDIGLGELAFDLHQDGVGGIDHQQINFYPLIPPTGRGTGVKLVDGDAPLLKQPHDGRAHLPFHKFAEAVAQFAKLLVHLLVLPG